jgi:hypothetical protein
MLTDLSQIETQLPVWLGLVNSLGITLSEGFFLFLLKNCAMLNTL